MSISADHSVRHDALVVSSVQEAFDPVEGRLLEGAEAEARLSVQAHVLVGEGVASLVCHSTYIDNLGEGAFDPNEFLRSTCSQVGGTIGVQFGIAFELIPV